MRVELYEMAHSPYCIPVAQALRALGVCYESKIVPNWDRSEIIELTQGAYYEVPLLVHDGNCVYESSPDSVDIARYVDATFGAGKLFPNDKEGLQSILIDFIENDLELVTFKLIDPYYLDTIEDLANRVHTIRHKERKFGRGCVERWRSERDSLRAEADRLLERFCNMLGASDFLLGSAPVYTDFALFGILGNLTYRGFNKLHTSQQKLIDWSERLATFRY